MKTNKQSGFTLIEMVAVIIILAIMAATALPRFVNLNGEARYSSLSGLAGGLRSAVALSKSKWLTAQSGEQATVDFNGNIVSVINYKTPESQVNGISYLGAPTGDDGITCGICAAMEDWGTYASEINAQSGIAFWPAGVTVSASCNVTYLSGVVTIIPANGSTAATDCN